jgi:hypothetical protein
VNDLIWPALREMSDDQLAERFSEWLQRRHPERYPQLLQLPLKGTSPPASNPRSS